MIRSENYIATPPGATIKEQLEDRGMSQKEFAARIDMSEKHVSKLINGEVQLTPEVAYKLEMVLGVPAKFWNNLEAIYREKLVRVNAENSIILDEALAKKLPYKEMAELGWVPETNIEKEKVFNLRRFFEVIDLSLLENRKITKIACKNLSLNAKDDVTLMTWAQEARIKAREIEVPAINIKLLTNMLPQLQQSTTLKQDEFIPSICSILAECGIVLVFVPKLSNSMVQGTTFIDGKKIIIEMCSGESNSDAFWFGLFHELGHIVLGHIQKGEGTTNEEEIDADIWAYNTLIPNVSYINFVNGDIYTETSICDFANELNINPGIIVGKLQKDGHINTSQLNHLKFNYCFSST